MDEVRRYQYLLKYLSEINRTSITYLMCAGAAAARAVHVRRGGRARHAGGVHRGHALQPLEGREGKNFDHLPLFVLYRDIFSQGL